jgi:L-iditol 2-dehydrogenase
MKALILKDYRQFAVEEVAIPRIGEGETLIRVRACGICGSDVHGMDGSSGRRRPPLIMGHEAAGEIAEVGPAVASWKAGDRVAIDSTVSCGACWHCRRGEVNLCENRRVLGVSCAEYRRDGAFAEYVAVPARILYRLPDAVTFEQGAMVEALGVAAHAVRRARLAPDSSVVVVGAGMIGLLVVQVLKAMGAGPIIAVDLDEGRLSRALKFGATTTIRGNDADIAGQVRALTGGRGADAAFEVVGRSATVACAIDSVRKGGSVTLVGNLDPKIDLPLQGVVTRELTLFGTCASAGEYPECLDLIAAGKANVTDFVSAVAPLEEGGRWFERLYAGEKGLMKVLLRP